jgi:hypothetical protein
MWERLPAAINSSSQANMKKLTILNKIQEAKRAIHLARSHRNFTNYQTIGKLIKKLERDINRWEKMLEEK